MRKNFLTNTSIFILTISISFTFSPPASAGGLKERIQQQLEVPSSIQYEPYYQETQQDYLKTRQDKKGRSVLGAEEIKQETMNCEITTLPREEWTSPQPSMSSYVIYNVHYTSDLEENVVTVKGKVLFEVFKTDGWTQIPLVSNNVGLIDVKVNKGSSFVTSQRNKYYLMMTKPGRYTLDIEFLLKASREREGGPGSFNVDVMPAPISQFEFTIPEKDVQIFVEPSIKVEQKTEADKTSAWAVMPNTNSINVRWTKALPKEEIVSVKLEPKVYAETTTHSSVGGGVIRSQSQLDYSILQSEISSLQIALPEDVSVLDVNGRDLRDWKASIKDDVQYLDIFLNFGRKGNYRLTLTYERSIPEGSGVVQMPWVRAMGVERENGFYGVAASTNVELAVKSTQNTTTIDTKQLPSNIWSFSKNPILLAFRYLNHPFDITIEVTRHEELPVLIAAIDSADHLTVHTKEGKVLTKTTYQLRNNVKQFLRLNLPKDSVIWSSFVAGKPVKPAKDKEGNILIPLEKSSLEGNVLTQIPVEIVYLDKGSEMRSLGRVKLNLPKADIPISEMYWSIYLPEDFSYFNFDGDVKEVKSIPRIQTMVSSVGRRFGRAVQGSVRHAADQIGDQFSPEQQMFVQKALTLSEAVEESSAAGVLPIKINIPQSGKLFQFSKLLVVEGESPWMTARYSNIPNKIEPFVRPIILIVVFYGLAVLILRIIRKKKTKKVLKKEEREE